MSIYTLYVKTHNKTGLKYLGQTTQDPYTYPGSGYTWTDHITEYGNDVSTDILLQTSEREELKYSGKYYSNLFKITSSVDDYGNRIWANRIPEVGGGGSTTAGWKHTAETRKIMSKPRSEEGRSNIKIAQQNKPPQTAEHKRKNSIANRGENNHAYGKTPSQVCCLGCRKVHDVANHNRAHGAKCGVKLKVNTRKKPFAQVSCLVCQEVHDVANHSRHHGAKCKTKQ